MKAPHRLAGLALLLLGLLTVVLARMCENQAQEPVQPKHASFARVGFRVTTTCAQVGALRALLRTIDHFRIPDGGIPSTFSAPGQPLLDQSPGPPTLHQTGPRWNHDDRCQIAIPVELIDDIIVTDAQNRCIDAGLADSGVCGELVSIGSRVATLSATWDNGDGGKAWWCDAGDCPAPTLDQDDSDGGIF